MDLRTEVVAKLRALCGEVAPLSSKPIIYRIGKHRVNLRTASEKSGDKYWFDVTPDLLRPDKVNFFLYACGSAEHIYVFPASAFRALVEGASMGGQKQVPNFTIYLDHHSFEPAGQAGSAKSIGHYHNAFSMLTESG